MLDPACFLLAVAVYLPVYRSCELVEIALGFAAGIVGLRVGKIVGELYVQVGQPVGIELGRARKLLFYFGPVVFVIVAKSDFSHLT